MSDVKDTAMKSFSHTWTKQDYLLALLAVLINIGDGVEVFLPGVITQKVSCELGLSDFQEGILAVIMFLFWAIATMISVPISEKLGDRFTMLLSLYLSIFFAILCAAVPNYYTLLLSRALIGICVGLNFSTVGISLAKLHSSKEVHTQSCFLSTFGFAVGGTWVSLLGWMILDIVNWRVFVLLTSIPLFVPPIIILHIFLNEKPDKVEEGDNEAVVEIYTVPTEADGLVDKMPQNIPNSNYHIRVFKASLFLFCSLCSGFGCIILVPWLMRSYKKDLVRDTENGNCGEVVQGNDFLILAAVTGATNLVGRPLGYFLWSRVKFVTLQFTITATMALSYGFVLAKPGIVASVILLGMAKLCYSIQSTETRILLYDRDYYGSSGFELGSAVTLTSGVIGAVVGTSLAAFLDYFSAILATLVIVCVELVVICVLRR